MKFNQAVKLQLQQPMMRYFIMASVVVGVEFVTFVFMNTILHWSYLIATPLSNIVAIILNWYFSRTFVFKKGSHHKKHTEIFLIFVVSIIGIGLQLAVSYISVEIFNLPPIFGKALAIVVVFFWSYWSRKRYIFKS